MILLRRFDLISKLRPSSYQIQTPKLLWNRQEPKTEETLSEDADHVDRGAFGKANLGEIVKAAEFYKQGEKSKENFLTVIEAFSSKTRFSTRMGQCEFIYGSMKMLKEYGLHQDIEVYKKLLSVMPKDKMVPKNFFQEMSIYYVKHQTTAVRLLSYMEQNHVVPDKEMENLVRSIFGEGNVVWRKVARMNYWMAKMHRASPFPLPEKMPNDSFELAKILLKRICPDIQTKVQAYQTEVLEDCLDKTWIVSAQSPSQREIIASLNEELYVEGPFNCMLRETLLNYFVLKTAPPTDFKEEEKDPNPFDVSNLKMNMFGGRNRKTAISKQQNLHKQKDGTILALCCTGTSSRDSLLSWIRILEHLDPNLKRLKVIFKLKAPVTGSLVPLTNNSNVDKQSQASETTS